MKTDEEIRAGNSTDPWVFTSIGRWHLSGRGDVYTVECPINCCGFDWLVGKNVKIDGVDHLIIGVESFAKKRTSRGEPIGLLTNSMGYGAANE